MQQYREQKGFPELPKFETCSKVCHCEAEAARALEDLANPSHLATATVGSEILSPLRYPGGKRRLAPFIAAVLGSNGRRPDITIEPFAGGASVALHLLQQNLTERIGLSDVDPLIAAFWQTVFFDTEWFIDRIGRVRITLPRWKQFKGGFPKTRRERALACLFLNRTSFSGILAATAGPLGGLAQTSKYKIGCRFPRAALQARIRSLGQLRDRVEFVWEASWSDAFPAINANVASNGWDTFTYLDPPFFLKAEKLYRYHFDDDEHRKLRDELVELKGDWLLSYDSVPRVAELYMNQKRLDLGAVYTTSTAGGYRRSNEAVVSNLNLPGTHETA